MLFPAVRRHDFVLYYSILATTLLLVAGCGSAPDASESRSADVPEIAENRTDNVTVDHSPESHLDSKPASPSEDSPPAAVPNHAKDLNETSSNAAAPLPQVVEPTSEQVARWSRLSVEPLQLLACRDVTSIGLVTEVAHTMDGRRLILAGTKLTLWSVTGDEPEVTLLEFDGDESIMSLAVSPDGHWIAAGDNTGTLHRWDLADHNKLISKKLASVALVDLAISTDGQEIATIGYDNEVSIWSADEMLPKNQFRVDTNSLKRIVYLNAHLLVAAGETTSIWDTGTGKVSQTLSPGRYNYTIARSPKGTELAFGEQDTLSLLSISDAKRNRLLDGPFSTDELLAFSNDETRLATANSTGVRVWDLASGQLLQVIDAFGSPVTGLNWLPESDLLVVTSLPARTRIWGTSKDGEAVGLVPLHSPASLPAPSSQTPATPTQFESVIDLRTFPRLGRSRPLVNDAFSLNESAMNSLDEAMQFYQYHLGRAGWSEVAPQVASPGSHQFQKSGFKVSVAMYETGQSQVNIIVQVLGNHDLRSIPKFASPSSESVFESDQVVMLRTKTPLVEIEASLLRQLHEAGWTPFSRLFSSHNDAEKRRDLEFLRDGLALHVSIGQDNNDPALSNIQYSQTLLPHSLPVPPDASFVEFDGSTQPKLVAMTSMNIAEAREFFEHEMTAQGWQIRELGSREIEDQDWLAFIRGQRDVTVNLKKMATGKTLVRVGDDLENASWQLATAPSTEPDDAASGIEAANFPILNAARTAKFDASGESVEVPMDEGTLPEIGERYTIAFQELGWALNGSGISSDDYVFLTFEKEKSEITLRGRLSAGKAIINFQGDGILWNKPLPDGPAVVSYETWLRTNHHPATLDLLDSFLAEMRSISDAR